MKAETGFLLSAQNSKIKSALFFLILLFLPAQFGQHFWPNFSYVLGIRVDYLSPTIYITDVLILLLFVFLITSLRKKIIQELLKKQFLLYLNLSFLGLSILIGIMLSKNPQAGLYGILKLIEFVFLGIYASRFVTKTNFKKVLFVFSIAIIFEALLAIFQYIQQGSIGGLFYFFGERAFNGQTPGIANASINGSLVLRSYGTFSHPNVLGGYLAIGMTLILFNLGLIKNKIEKNLYLGSLLLGTLALATTLSRITILRWIVILFIFFISKEGKNFLKKNRTFILILFSLILFFLFYSPIFLRLFNFNLHDESLSNRGTLIESSLEIIKNNLFFGAGLNNFLIELAQIKQKNSVIFYLQPVHNIFLLVAAQAGIIGLTYSLFFLAKTFKKAFEKKELINYKSIIFLSILILGSFDHYFLTIQQGQLLLSFMLGLIWAKFKS